MHWVCRYCSLSCWLRVETVDSHMCVLQFLNLVVLLVCRWAPFRHRTRSWVSRMPVYRLVCQICRYRKGFYSQSVGFRFISFWLEINGVCWLIWIFCFKWAHTVLWLWYALLWKDGSVDWLLSFLCVFCWLFGCWVTVCFYVDNRMGVLTNWCGWFCSVSLLFGCLFIGYLVLDSLVIWLLVHWLFLLLVYWLLVIWLFLLLVHWLFCCWFIGSLGCWFIGYLVAGSLVILVAGLLVIWFIGYLVAGWPKF